MNIYRQVLATDGPKQNCVLGLHRSDYMQHEVAGDPRVLLQVELNTIASSFGSLSSKVFHTFVTFDKLYHFHHLTICLIVSLDI
jgi:hypothetical protein